MAHIAPKCRLPSGKLLLTLLQLMRFVISYTFSRSVVEFNAWQRQSWLHIVLVPPLYLPMHTDLYTFCLDAPADTAYMYGKFVVPGSLEALRIHAFARGRVCDSLSAASVTYQHSILNCVVSCRTGTLVHMFEIWIRTGGICSHHMYPYFCNSWRYLLFWTMIHGSNPDLSSCLTGDV